jgi:hypothetical protein
MKFAVFIKKIHYYVSKNINIFGKGLDHRLVYTDRGLPLRPLYWRAQWKVVSRLEKEFPTLYTDSSLPHLPLLVGTVAGSINTGEGIPHPFHRQQSPPPSSTGGHGGR